MRATEMAGHLIRRIHQMSVHVFSSTLQEAGLDLTPVQFAALDTIQAHPGLDQACIATRIACDRATVGGVIDRLMQKSLIERKISKRDRRAHEIRITSEGRRLHDLVLPIVETLQGDILSGLDTEECKQFYLLAKKALNASKTGTRSGT